MAAFSWTPKRIQFCIEFLIDLNQAGAARRAGFSEATAKHSGHELCQLPEIRDRIQDLMNERADRVRITADQVLTELKNVMLADPNEAYDKRGVFKPLKDIPIAVRRCIAGIKSDELFEEDDDGKQVLVGYCREIKWWSKDKAMELAARHLKLIGGDINIQIGLASELEQARARVKRMTVLGRATNDATTDPPSALTDETPEDVTSANAG